MCTLELPVFPLCLEWPSRLEIQVGLVLTEGPDRPGFVPPSRAAAPASRRCSLTPAPTRAGGLPRRRGVIGSVHAPLHAGASLAAEAPVGPRGLQGERAPRSETDAQPRLRAALRRPRDYKPHNARGRSRVRTSPPRLGGRGAGGWFSGFPRPHPQQSGSAPPAGCGRGVQGASPRGARRPRDAHTAGGRRAATLRVRRLARRRPEPSRSLRSGPGSPGTVSRPQHRLPRAKGVCTGAGPRGPHLPRSARAGPRTAST